MNIPVFSKVFLALIVYSCVTASLVPGATGKDLAPLYEAAVDIVTTCYGDSHKTIGIAGDSDGSFLRALRSNYLNAVVLIDVTTLTADVAHPARLHKLDVFIIAAESLNQFVPLMKALWDSIWWNSYANFLVLDTTPNADGQCLRGADHMLVSMVIMGVLNVQFICFYQAREIFVLTANPFTPHAPKAWTFLSQMRHEDYSPFYMFVRTYQKGGRNCEDLNFSKTTDIGGYPLHFIMFDLTMTFLLTGQSSKRSRNDTNVSSVLNSIARADIMWFIENIISALNGTAVLTIDDNTKFFTMSLNPYFFAHTDTAASKHVDRLIFSQHQIKAFATSQHTPHKSQIEKILTIIDSHSRIGMLLVYLGIYTGNLASLLTTIIAYPNVNTKEDIAHLGYTVYAYEYMYNKLAADPNFGDRVIKVPSTDMSKEKCSQYVLNDPLAVCILEDSHAAYTAKKWNLHISRYPIISDFSRYPLSDNNPLGRRLEALMLLWAETGLRRSNETVNQVLLQFVDDDEVKNNMARRVMTVDDLRFAFEILIVGLSCSLICFISELVIFRIRLKMAKKRDRAPTRLAWEPTKKNCFSSLNFRFNPRRIF